jgi:hypothetical protein
MRPKQRGGQHKKSGQYLDLRPVLFYFSENNLFAKMYDANSKIKYAKQMEVSCDANIIRAL